jgi:hypothetical protein
VTSDPEPTQSVNVPRTASGPPPSGPPSGSLPPGVPPPPSVPPPGAAPPAADLGPTATLPPAPAAQPKAPADRGALVRAALGVLVLALTVAALAIEENEQQGYDDWTTWAVFATVMAAVHLLPLVWKAEPRRVWDVVAVATGGLTFYWLALVLPMIGNATSFVQTLAVACAGAHLWLLPGRR